MKIDDTKSTKNTHKALKKFLDKKITNDDVRSEAYTKIVNILYDKACKHEVVYLNEDILPIIDSIETQYPDSFDTSVSSFTNFCDKQDLHYQGSFSPNKDTIEKYVKFKNIRLGDSLKFSGNMKEFTKKAKIKKYQDAPSKLLIDLTSADEKAQMRKFDQIEVIPD